MELPSYDRVLAINSDFESVNLHSGDKVVVSLSKGEIAIINVNHAAPISVTFPHEIERNSAVIPRSMMYMPVLQLTNELSSLQNGKADGEFSAPCCGGRLELAYYGDLYRKIFRLTSEGTLCRPYGVARFVLQWQTKRSEYTIAAQRLRILDSKESLTFVGCRNATHDNRHSAMNDIFIEPEKIGENTVYYARNSLPAHYVMLTVRTKEDMYQREHTYVLPPGKKDAIWWNAGEDWEFIGIANATRDDDYVSNPIVPPGLIV